jgi:hypothetical protein
VAPFPNGHHLVRTRDWLVALEPDAGEALRIAALTHDIERNYPGGPRQRADAAANDRSYRDVHQARSVEVVSAWLAEQGRDDLVQAVSEIVGGHEWGGSPGADLVQAADSISFLETTAREAPGWIREGRYSRERTVDQIKWMYERIRLHRARELARPFFERAMRDLPPHPDPRP